MAASVSPPPAIENAEEFAMASAMALVPDANASNSNTPTGPFQTIVPASAITVLRAATVVGPRSRMRSSAPTFSIALSSGLAFAENSRATTASIGIGTLPGNSSRMALASPTRSASASDLPILPPAARMNVLAMPPPTIRQSTFAASARRIVSLVETFDPATIATSGRRGWASALPSASSSAASSGPAQAMAANFARP